VTDPASPTRPAAPAAADRAAPLPALRLLTTDDDLACVDDLCLPAGARDRLDVPAADPATPATVTERDR
jgi:hypothetical protein